jgi:uridine kinase
MSINTRSIAEAISTLPEHQKPILIGIDGFGGSGKTTFSAKLAAMLGNTYVIHMDDFIVKDKMHESSWDEGFDRKRLAEQVLEPLANSRVASYQKLLWESDTLSDYQDIPTVNYVIIEGITSLHPKIRKYYDYKIWVDTPIDIAKARGEARDADNENVDMWDLWASNDLRYQAQYHPDEAADVIVSGT